MRAVNVCAASLLRVAESLFLGTTKCVMPKRRFSWCVRLSVRVLCCVLALAVDRTSSVCCCGQPLCASLASIVCAVSLLRVAESLVLGTTKCEMLERFFCCERVRMDEYAEV